MQRRDWEGREWLEKLIGLAIIKGRGRIIQLGTKKYRRGIRDDLDWLSLIKVN